MSSWMRYLNSQEISEYFARYEQQVQESIRSIVMDERNLEGDMEDEGRNSAETGQPARELTPWEIERSEKLNTFYHIWDRLNRLAFSARVGNTRIEIPVTGLADGYAPALAKLNSYYVKVSHHHEGYDMDKVLSEVQAMVRGRPGAGTRDKDSIGYWVEAAHRKLSEQLWPANKRLMEFCDMGYVPAGAAYNAATRAVNVRLERGGETISYYLCQPGLAYENLKIFAVPGDGANLPATIPRGGPTHEASGSVRMLPGRPAILLPGDGQDPADRYMTPAPEDAIPVFFGISLDGSCR